MIVVLWRASALTCATCVKPRGLRSSRWNRQLRSLNAYLSQIERGLRRPPHPEILRRLAKVYGVSHRELLIEAQYLDEDSGQQTQRDRIEKAFEHVTSDPTFRHGTRLKGHRMSLEAKRLIIEMYEKMTNRKLLEEA
jgi:transcriptional regulator with XRE-family HTH domain